MEPSTVINTMDERLPPSKHPQTNTKGRVHFNNTEKKKRDIEGNLPRHSTTPMRPSALEFAKYIQSA
jgi:hypothetical protein